MVSAIDPTKPVDGVLMSKADFRANLLAARDEILALQAEGVALRTAIGIASGATALPDLGGANTPSGSQTLPTILLALDAAITAAAGSGGGGGPITLSDITDILAPSEAQRAAFQAAISGVTQTSNFNFDEGSQGGRFITMDTASNSVTMTLPDPAGLSRPDGLLCLLTATSGTNFASITAASAILRFQPQINGQVPNQQTVFVGESRAAGFSTIMAVYKDGPVYRLDGAGRISEAANITRNAPGTVDGAAMVALSLIAASFPNLLNLGGTKQAGGNRSIFRNVAGNTTLAQTDSGTIVVHTGAGTATWDVPDLSDGTVIEVENQGGQITFNPTGSDAVVGALTLPADASGAARFLNSEIKFIGTS